MPNKSPILNNKTFGDGCVYNLDSCKKIQMSNAFAIKAGVMADHSGKNPERQRE